MAKKIIVAILVAIIAGAYVMAQDAAKPAGPAAPKTGIQLTQVIENDTYDQAIDKSPLAAGYAIYTQTSLKGQVEFDLGGGFKMVPSITERFETQLAKSATPVAFRNRLYFALNNTLAIDKAFNLGLNLEHRVQTTLGQTSQSYRTFLANQFTPTLNFNGKIDVFYYSLSQGLNYGFDSSIVEYSNNNGKDDSYISLPGTYNLGVQFALDQAISLKIDLTDSLTLNNVNDTAKDYISNSLRAKVFLIAGDFTPAVGFVMYNEANPADDSAKYAIVGASVGVDLKVGSNATFSVTADIAQDSAEAAIKASTDKNHTPAVTNIAATLVFKY